MPSPTIQQIVAQIRTALFGKDVRENIALGIEKCYEDATNGIPTSAITRDLNVTASGKVLDARAGKDLNDKFDNYIPTTNIVNNLSSSSTTKVLGAGQGKALNDKFGNYIPTANIVNGLTETESGKVLDARQGKVLNEKFNNYFTRSEVIKAELAPYSEDHAVSFGFNNGGILETTGLNNSSTHDNDRIRTNYINLSDYKVPLAIYIDSTNYNWTMWAYTESNQSSALRSLTNTSYKSADEPVYITSDLRNCYIRFAVERKSGEDMTVAVREDITANLKFKVLTDDTLTKSGVPADAKSVGDKFSNYLTRSEVIGSALSAYSEDQILTYNLNDGGIHESSGQNNSSTHDADRVRTTYIDLSIHKVPFAIYIDSTSYNWTMWAYSSNGQTSALKSLSNNSYVSADNPIYIPSDLKNCYIRFAVERKNGSDITVAVRNDIIANLKVKVLTDNTLMKNGVPADAKAVGDKFEDYVEKTDIVNGLTETASGKVLDASQGKALNDKFDNYTTLAEYRELYSESQSFTYSLLAGGILESTGRNNSSAHDADRVRTTYINLSLYKVPFMIYLNSTNYRWTMWAYSEGNESSALNSLTDSSYVDAYTPIIIHSNLRERYIRFAVERKNGAEITDAIRDDIIAKLRIKVLTDDTLAKAGIPADAKAVSDYITNNVLNISGNLMATDNIDTFRGVGIYRKTTSVNPINIPSIFANSPALLISTIDQNNGSGVQIIIGRDSSMYRTYFASTFSTWRYCYEVSKNFAGLDLDTFDKFGHYFKAKNESPAGYSDFTGINDTASIFNFVDSATLQRGIQLIIDVNGVVGFRSKDNTGTWQNWVKLRDEVDGALERGTSLLDTARTTVMGYNYSNKYINFGYITDTHFGGTRSELYEARHNIKLFTQFANEGFLDFVVHGGDLITDYQTNRDEAINWIDDTTDILSDITIPHYISPGNHEMNLSYLEFYGEPTWDEQHKYFVRSSNNVEMVQVTQDTWNGTSQLYVMYDGQLLSPAQQLILLQNHVDNKVVDENNPLGCYFYVDRPDLKLRIIVLNSFPIRYNNGVSERVSTYSQGAWLANTALHLEDPTNWKVIVFSHSIVENTVLNALDAFVHGTRKKLSTNYDDWADFREQGPGKLIANIHGHGHRDEEQVVNDILTIGTNCGFTEKAYLFPASDATKTGFSFSVFTIDTDNNVMYETRIGDKNPYEPQGRTRHWSWDLYQISGS